MARERSDPPVAPLILTAEPDPATQAWLDDLRARHFPPARNHLHAHLTLFHALPRAPELPVSHVLEAVIDAPYKFGRGVAFAVTCPPLLALRSRIAAAFAGELTRQDVGWRRPHVTVQNKVAPEQAAALHASLSAGYEPRAAQITGLALWSYEGGPWAFVDRVVFG